MKGGKKRLKPPPGIPRAACWAHVRRKFFEGAKAGCPLCARLLKNINVLYRIEGRSRELGLDAEQRTLLRHHRARRGVACSSALGQWPGLLLYLDHGVIEAA